MNISRNKIAIVIVNWNRKDDLLALVGSLNDAGYYEKYDIIVIDNASSDDSVNVLQKYYSKVCLIQNVENLGGTGGFNTGLRYCISKNYAFVWLLDNDALVLPGSLEPLLEAVLADSNIGLAGSKLLHPHDVTLINEAGAMIDSITARPRPLYMNQRDKILAPLLEVDYVAVCSVLVRLSSVERVGLMDDAYFLMWDDMEWGMRFCKAGYRVVVVTDSRVTHPGFSERSLTNGFIYYATRNHFYFISRIYSGLQRSYLVALLAGGIVYKAVREKWITGKLQTSTICTTAENDFWSLRMGRNQHIFGEFNEPEGVSLLEFSVQGFSAVVLSTQTSDNSVREAVLQLKKAGVQVILYGDKVRENIFSWFDGPCIWRSGGILGYFELIWKMSYYHYDAAIIYYHELSRFPFQFGKKLIRINKKLEVISISPSQPIKSLISETMLTIFAVSGFIYGFSRALFRIATRNTLSKVDRTY